MARHSCLSANDKGNSEIIPGAVNRSPGINSKEKLLKTSARRPSIKAMRPVIASNRVTNLQMRSVRSHSTSGREEDGIKKGRSWIES